MQILLVGDGKAASETHQKLLQCAPTHATKIITNLTNNKLLKEADVIIDVHFDEEPSHYEQYTQIPHNKILLLGCLKRQLATLERCNPKINCIVGGFNNFPTFINRSLWEVSYLHEHHRTILSDTLTQMGIEHRFVADRIGMVTPRVVAMIINEAALTLQEKTANIADIDQAMKLGTNYPFGPFEWADRIGIAAVYELLDALYKDTYDERYKIAPLLKTHYLRQQNFLSTTTA